jgi:hypothetical protein
MSDGHMSEFLGVEAGVQVERIRSGLEILQKIFGDAVTGFVPPWNSYDANTVAAVGKVGLKYLSAGEAGPKGDTSVVCIPRTCRIDQLDAGLNECLSLKRYQPIMVVVLHPDNFEEFRDPPHPGEDAGFYSLKKLRQALGGIDRSRDSLNVETVHGLAHRLLSRGGGDPKNFVIPRKLPYRLSKRFPRHLIFEGLDFMKYSSIFIGGLSGMLK